MLNDVKTFSLAGKKALITGASRGIGASIALAFAQAGADVALCARSLPKLEEVAQLARQFGVEAHPIVADITDADDVKRLTRDAAQSLGGIDLLVLNAGGALVDETGAGLPPVPLHETPDEDWTRVVDLNVTSSYRLCRETYPHLKEGSDPAVVFISSLAANLATVGYESYSAAKAAQVGLMRSLAAAWAPSGIRVNCVCPGFIATDLTRPVRSSEMGSALIERVPQGRWGSSQEVAWPTVFLASSAASLITGQSIVVDGGLSIVP